MITDIVDDSELLSNLEKAICRYGCRNNGGTFCIYDSSSHHKEMACINVAIKLLLGEDAFYPRPGETVGEYGKKLKKIHNLLNEEYSL